MEGRTTREGIRCYSLSHHQQLSLSPTHQDLFWAWVWAVPAKQVPAACRRINTQSWVVTGASQLWVEGQGIEKEKLQHLLGSQQVSEVVKNIWLHQNLLHKPCLGSVGREWAEKEGSHIWT
jgi:hypothetical protein